MAEATVQMRGIRKQFPSCLANDNVDFTAYRGEIHALLGENGAGKSTLMSILTGVLQPDAGEICINGKPVMIRTPKDALQHGIGMIYQHFKLVKPFSVAENIVLSDDHVKVINKKKLEARVKALSERYCIEIDPGALTWQLSIGEQQRVEILKVLYRNANILILDEPTAVLTAQEVQELFLTLRKMTDSGCTVIFITHKMNEVMDYADRITVLRDGCLVRTLTKAETDEKELAKLMVGREISMGRRNTTDTTTDRELLRVENLTVLNDKKLEAVRKLSFSLYAGASAAGICRTLIEKGHDAFLLDVFLGLEHAPEHLEDVFTLPGHGLEIAKNISCEEPDLAAVKASRPDQSDCFLGPNVIELCRLADITFLGLHGGEGENGKLQATFDLLGIRYTGPDSLGCAVAMDKGLTKQVFLQAGIDTPAGVTIHKKSKDRSLALTGLSLPVVIKPCSGGSSIGVYIVSTEEEYAEALEKSFFYEDEVVVEEYIKGREFACGVIDNEALPPIEIIPKTGFFDYANKYQADATLEVCPADIPEETASRMMELTVKAFRALKLNVYSRADFLLDEKGNLYCLEMNTLPGMTAASLLPKEAKAAGIEYGDLCELIIKKSLEARY